MVRIIDGSNKRLLDKRCSTVSFRGGGGHEAVALIRLLFMKL